MSEKEKPPVNNSSALWAAAAVLAIIRAKTSNPAEDILDDLEE
ncbi:hypothetical protein Back11_13050 [Paenibacillus baekrokdamisoli]|uniref:Uncharacterized protein n=1 Tax=Paenibacillus baekrokdamisoli TaxID=1712516 RepID=A0A3G9IM94_9BACL|nr:hypothetical protein [Paenibacillus baekrokdamisoli]MBB3070609.1 hypothetical protein [Paenibacillus baekrokdamisoli]BBH19960.1 hypothetical protein Back11_13050 [Paenibacillus baekrokdamisoli]